VPDLRTRIEFSSPTAQTIHTSRFFLSRSGDSVNRFLAFLLIGVFVGVQIVCLSARAEGPTERGASDETTKSAANNATTSGPDAKPNSAPSNAVSPTDRQNLNVLWLLVTGFLVIVMQAGFAMVETGLTRSKNVTHTMTMTVATFALGTLAFFVVGFALMYGGAAGAAIDSHRAAPHEISITVSGREFGLFGFAQFFLAAGAADGALLAVFFSQAVLANVATTIPTGAMAERWKFRAFVYFVLFMAAIVYPVFGNWVWGGGWLAQLNLGRGFVDFAGSSVIHLVGGMAAVAGCRVLGPRIGKYNRDGSLNVLLPHSVPLYMAGTVILAFGWFGLITGRAMFGTDLMVGRVATNALLASAAGATAAMIYMWTLYKKPDPSFICNGLLAGLVAISAPCAFVTPLAAVVIGLVAGVLVVWSVLFLERATRLDDPVGAISVHGINGAWGVLAVGLFADGSYRGVSGLFHGGGQQLVAQTIGLVACIIWTFVTSWVFFRIVGVFVGNRVGPTSELQGLDVPELGVVGYFNEDPAAAKGSTSRAFAEPRAAAAPPPASENRFSIVIEGTDAASVKAIWNELCQPSDRPSDPDFVAVYPLMTLIKGNRFRFRGGEPDDVRSRMERLVIKRLPEKAIRARIEG
jgi:Amt family ammonium transporter